MEFVFHLGFSTPQQTNNLEAFNEDNAPLLGRSETLSCNFPSSQTFLTKRNVHHDQLGKNSFARSFPVSSATSFSSSLPSSPSSSSSSSRISFLRMWKLFTHELVAFYCLLKFLDIRLQIAASEEFVRGFALSRPGFVPTD